MRGHIIRSIIRTLQKNTYVFFCLLVLSHQFINPNFLVSAKDATDADTVIGIDLGTTYSCVGIIRESGQVDVLSNDMGRRTTPSWVALLEDGTIYVGEAAKSHSEKDPSHTFFDSKRLIGRTWNETQADKKIKEQILKYPFKISNSNGKPVFEASYSGNVKRFTPEEISAKVLIKMKEIAEGSLGHEVRKAVITVPAYFNDSQRQATKDAGQIAKLEVVRILNEPTAAAISFGLDKKGASKILVYDLGGGTFDVSALELDDGVFEVKAVAGDNYLGGQDFDQKIIDWAVEIAEKKYKVLLKNENKLMNKLRGAVEKIKMKLSSETTATLEIENINTDGDTFSETLTRAKFEDLNRDFFRNTLVPVEEALKGAKWAKKDVDHIVLVGGSTRIPKVQELLTKFFDGKELDKTSNPDEAVALGAALQAGVLMGHKKTKDILVIDAIPLTLGIETLHGVFTSIIDRNTPIPARKTQIFSTADDNQTQVTIKVYEGERKFAKDNHLLGTFDLSGIPLAPRGVPKIEVTFEVDVNGILTVTAKDQGSGSSQSIRISNDKGRLSQADIERMIKDAEQHQDEDKKRRELIEAQDQYERYIYQLKDQVHDESSLGGKISESEKKEILNAVEDGKKWLDENRNDASKEDYDEQKSKIEKLVGPIVTKLYGDAKAAPSDHDEL